MDRLVLIRLRDIDVSAPLSIQLPCDLAPRRFSNVEIMPGNPWNLQMQVTAAGSSFSNSFTSAPSDGSRARPACNIPADIHSQGDLVSIEHSLCRTIGTTQTRFRHFRRERTTPARAVLAHNPPYTRNHFTQPSEPAMMNAVRCSGCTALPKIPPHRTCFARACPSFQEDHQLTSTRSHVCQ